MKWTKQLLEDSSHLMCCFRWLDFLYALLQNWHLYGRSLPTTSRYCWNAWRGFWDGMRPVEEPIHYLRKCFSNEWTRWIMCYVKKQIRIWHYGWMHLPKSVMRMGSCSGMSGNGKLLLDTLALLAFRGNLCFFCCKLLKWDAICVFLCPDVRKILSQWGQEKGRTPKREITFWKHWQMKIVLTHAFTQRLVIERFGEGGSYQLSLQAKNMF